jgi:hypothetical protein
VWYPRMKQALMAGITRWSVLCGTESPGSGLMGIPVRWPPVTAEPAEHLAADNAGCVRERPGL